MPPVLQGHGRVPPARGRGVLRPAAAQVGPKHERLAAGARVEAR